MIEKIDTTQFDFLSEFQQSFIPFVAFHHANQKRRYTGEDYVYHPIKVAQLLIFILDDKQTDAQVVAALFHDVIEDTDCTYEEIKDYVSERCIEFDMPDISDDVVKLVYELTDVYTKEDYPELNREHRKLKEAERLRSASIESRYIKLADIIDNSHSIEYYDPKFAKVYLHEKDNIMKCMGMTESYLIFKDICYKLFYQKIQNHV